MELLYFILTHEHRHDTSTYVITSYKDITDRADEENPPDEKLQGIIDMLDINFEPERGETIEIVQDHAPTHIE